MSCVMWCNHHTAKFCRFKYTCYTKFLSLVWTLSIRQLDSVVGIATRYGWTVWGSHPCMIHMLRTVQIGPEVHLSSSIAGCGSFSGVKQPHCGTDHPFPSVAQLRVGYHSLPSVSCIGMSQGDLQLSAILLASMWESSVSTYFIKSSNIGHIVKLQSCNLQVCYLKPCRGTVHPEVCYTQWRTHEFCSRGRFNKFSWGQRTENGDLGAAVIWYNKFHFIE